MILAIFLSFQHSKPDTRHSIIMILCPLGARFYASFECLLRAVPHSTEIDIINGNPGVEMGVTLVLYEVLSSSF